MGTRADTQLSRSGSRHKGKALALEPGYILDKRYRLIRLLGVGGMGQVFEAEHLILKELRAVKILHKFGDNDSTPVERFLSEARIPTKLKHPNIVDVSDAGVSPDGVYFIAMALLKGESLQAWMAKTPLENRDQSYIDKLCSYLLEACEGLQTAHRHNVLHRDLKPANIFLHVDESEREPEIVPKLLDFGVAKSLDIQKMTLTGDVLGTPGYISPEVLSGQSPNIRSDIFSMGVILYEGLTGKPPFGRESRSAAYWETISADFRVTPPTKLNPNVSKQLSRACMKALERDPDNRFQTAIDFGEAMVNAASKLRIPVPPPKRKIGKWLVAVTLFGAVSLMAGAWALVSQLARNEARSFRTDIGNAGRPASAIEKPREVTPPPAGKSSEPAPKATSGTEVVAPTEPDTDQGVIKAQSNQPTRDKVPESGNSGAQGAAAAGDGKRARAADLTRQGSLALKDMKVEEAKRLFEKAVDIEPRAAEAWFGLAKVSVEEEQYDEAIGRVHRALNYSDVPRWRVFLGQAYQSAGKMEAAIKEWRRVVAHYPDDRQAVGIAEDFLKRSGADKQ